MRPLAEFIRGHFPTARMYNFRGPRDLKRAPSDLSIYLNREVVLAHDLTALPPPAPGEAQIYIELQRHNAPEPQAAPGWRWLHKVKRDRDWYHAFIRE
jgi:hypothetical protein